MPLDVLPQRSKLDFVANCCSMPLTVKLNRRDGSLFTTLDQDEICAGLILASTDETIAPCNTSDETCDIAASVASSLIALLAELNELQESR